MSAASEAIVSNIKTLVVEGYIVSVEFTGIPNDEGERMPVYVVTVEDERGKFVSNGIGDTLSEAMAEAYSQTPETEE
jgi:hypothetical protein